MLLNFIIVEFMKQKFRVSWKLHLDDNTPLSIVCDNWCVLAGALSALAENCVFDVKIDIL